jgi:hypothetical protein
MTPCSIVSEDFANYSKDIIDLSGTIAERVAEVTSLIEDCDHVLPEWASISDIASECTAIWVLRGEKALAKHNMALPLVFIERGDYLEGEFDGFIISDSEGVADYDG